MRVTLIFPNYVLHDEFGEPSDPPLGLASIAAVLEEKGYKVSLIDASMENLTINQTYSRLAELKPDIVGISCNYSPLHNPTLELAKMVKSEFGIPVIVGGNHATAMAENLLRQSNGIDVIVRGEGEKIMPGLLEILQHGLQLSQVKGITYREGDSVVNTPDVPLIADLDELPMPAYYLLPVEKYRRFNIMSSRGCPFDCGFCASHVVFSRKVRYRSPKRVMDEIEYLLKNYGEKPVWFSDDTFTTKQKYTVSLMDELVRRKLGIKWSCLLRVDVITRQLLETMRDAGCVYISYGIESGNQEILNKIGKGITVDEILITLDITHQVGIRQYAFFMVGYPGETWDTIMDSYKLIYQSKLDGAAFSVLIPLPGSRVMSELLEQGLIRLDEIKWDYLFARTLKEGHLSYSADLASRWCELSGTELIEACEIGRHFPEISRHIHNGN